MTDKEIIKRLYKDYVNRYLKKIFLALFFSVIIAGSTAAVAWLLDPAIKKIFVEKNKEFMYLIPIAIIYAFTIKGVSLYLVRTTMIIVGQSIEKEVQHVSLWGHTPHYVTSSTNPNVTLALLNRAMNFGEFEVDVQLFVDEGDRFINRVNWSVEIKGEIKSYVQKLEQAYDLDVGTNADIPSSETMIEELEKFLNNQMPKNE